MADFSKPTVGSSYADFVGEVKGIVADVARALDPATTSPSNVPVDSIRFASANKRWERWTGLAWVENSDLYAINIGGNAATATKLAAARSIALAGALTGSASFDGSANISIDATLADSGVTSGSYGGATAIPVLTVNAKGVVTGVSTVGLSYAWGSLTGKPTTFDGLGVTLSQGNVLGALGYTPLPNAGATHTGHLTISSGRLIVKENGAGNMSFIEMCDDESPNGRKYLHANSNCIGFLGGDGSWKMYAREDGHIWSPAYGLLSDYVATAVSGKAGANRNFDWELVSGTASNSLNLRDNWGYGIYTIRADNNNSFLIAITPSANDFANYAESGTAGVGWSSAYTGRQFYKLRKTA